MDVYVWGTQDAEPVAETLPALAMRVLREVREFDSINCALGATDFFGIRNGVLVELRFADPGGLQVRFSDGLRAGQAWSVAHAFLWLVTRQTQVAEAVLLGGDDGSLRFRHGRITRAATWFSDELS
ncbi:hypothetical protein [Saccharopolyspora dendranthemae]|uniref:Uncharacterized protein n=1 Tax=Saccharopolyspora dendranthemae TaxID=1181886 RepID=A0A561U566_9PSEU|nr:hypothetical protein [Saccharopolyspora dendranthemae]TWF94508.1 hypothetical protein FHU35_13219 [Saccharopolyspora dendranthemae]